MTAVNAVSLPERMWFVRIAFGMGPCCVSEIRVANAKEAGMNT
jgi:hypothetical protein